MVYGLRQFRPYILGHRTVIRSDHAALMFLKRAKEMVGQQARLLDVIDFIEQFTLDLQHRRGASHNNADALSRRPCTHRATRAGSVLDFRTTGRILRRRRRAFRPKISGSRDWKCRETLRRQPDRRGPSLSVHALANKDVRRLATLRPEWMTPRCSSPLLRVGGDRRASVETTETVTGRPGQAGLRRRRLGSIRAIPSKLISGRIRPDRTGSGRIMSNRPGTRQNRPC